MADGDVLTIQAGHQAFAAPAGGVQDITLLGPYPIAWDDADADPNGNGLVLAALEPGPRVVGVFVETVTPWNGSKGSGAIRMAVGIGGPDYLSGYWDTIAVLERSGQGPTHGYVIGWAQVNLYGGHVTGPDDGVLIAQFDWDVAATQGTADIYALIATPA